MRTNNQQGLLYILLSLFLVLGLTISTKAQTQAVQDDFEGSGTITSWFGDDCGINTSLTNPFQEGINTSTTVLEYDDNGGQFANVRFDVPNNFDLSSNHTFSLKIYVPTSGLTGSQTNQVSLKLQDGNLNAPWSTQSEIIKSITLDQWQTISFDFKNDNYRNLDANSSPPIQRGDFNRVVIQVNGEDNNDQVLAYLDDFSYDGTIVADPDPVFNTLVWSDEFDEDGEINADNWFHQTQLPEGGSWYNGEIQHYTNRTDNTFVSNGMLNIVAKKEQFTDQGHTKSYTSARLNSKFAFKYGRVEFRAKLPTGIGTWPALWMLGKNINEDGGYWDNQGLGTTPWPACGEIDVMEHWGDNQNYVQSATHTPSSFGGTINHGGRVVSTASTDFHVYALEWSPKKLVFSVDGVTHYTYNPEIKDANTWPFDEEQYLLLNIAIQPGIDQSFTESTMEVDYVRVYQLGTVSTSEENSSERLNYYPNPIADELNIILNEACQENVNLKIYSIDGQLIKSYNQSVNGNKLTLNNLSYLSRGLYIINLHVKNRVYNLNVFKN